MDIYFEIEFVIIHNVGMWLLIKWKIDVYGITCTCRSFMLVTATTVIAGGGMSWSRLNFSGTWVHSFHILVASSLPLILMYRTIIRTLMNMWRTHYLFWYTAYLWSVTMSKTNGSPFCFLQSLTLVNTPMKSVCCRAWQ